MVSLCPTCGRPEPLHVPASLTRRQGEIFDFVNKHPGCSIWHIIDAVYGRVVNDPKLIHVHINHINSKIIAENLRIVSSRGKKSTYVVKELK